MKLGTAGFILVILAMPIACVGVQAASKPAPAKAAPKNVQAKKAAPAKSVMPKKSVAANAMPRPGLPLSEQVYATLPGFRPLTLDLYQPKRAPKDFPKPALVFVHGGGWSGGDSRQGGSFSDFPGVLAGLAAKGYVVASVNYRLSGEARYPAAVQDVKAAIRWLRAHANDYNIDTTRVAVWGEEAGGQIAGLVGTSCGVAVLEPASDTDKSDNLPSDCVQAVIDSHGISDLAAMGDQPAAGPTAEGAYLGCEPAKCAPGVVRTASPISYIDENSPPFLIQHGAHKTVPLDQSQKLYDALQAAHVPSELVIYADSDTDVGKKTLDKIESFLDQTFPKKPMNKKPPRITSKALPY